MDLSSSGLKRRIIPCLDVKDGVVVKGVRFREHEVVGEILPLVRRYRAEGADELVFYDISASAERRLVATDWVRAVARELDIPFCVAGGIGSVAEARAVLNAGADKISVNSPALADPSLINRLAAEFGRQCVVVGIDAWRVDGDYCVYQYTGVEAATKRTRRSLLGWASEAVERGAGELVLNAMVQDGTRLGFDLPGLKLLRAQLDIPLIASGGAGSAAHFVELFQNVSVEGALAAGIFHRQELSIRELKNTLHAAGVNVRL